MRDSAVMDLTEKQQAALDHARAVLAEESIATPYLDAEWRRELRMALRDILAAFDQGEAS
jgi:hypothetical protein